MCFHILLYLQGIDGERIARVSYSQIHSVNIGTKSAKERQQRRGNVGDDWLDNLRRHLHWMNISKTRRFTLDTVKKTFKQMQEAQETVCIFHPCLYITVCVQLSHKQYVLLMIN